MGGADLRGLIFYPGLTRSGPSIDNKQPAGIIDVQAGLRPEGLKLSLAQVGDVEYAVLCEQL